MFYVFIALVLTPVVEIAVFIKAGALIGFWPTLGTVVVTAILGTWLLRLQGLATLQKVQESLNQGQMPVDQVFDGLCLLVAGIVLLTPGFVTDAIGFALFIPPLRRFLGQAIMKKIMASGSFHMHTHNMQSQGFERSQGFDQNSHPRHREPAQNGIIEGDYRDLTDEPDDDSSKSPPTESPWNK